MLETERRMKDSGVTWIGDVPDHWAVAPLYARYEVQLGKMLDARRITGEHLAPYLRNVDVQWGRINIVDLPQMDFPEEFKARYALKPGDLLVCEGGEVGRAAIWHGPLDECYYQKALHRLRPLSFHDSTRYLFYVLRAAAFRGVFTAERNPNTIDHLPAEKLRVHRFPFPSPGEQRAIAKILDRKSAAIDAIIQKKERLASLLQEMREAVISRAVTRGLDPTMPTRDSGIKWIGNIPEHWDVPRIKWVARMESGHTPDKKVEEYWTNCDIPWVSLNDTAYLKKYDFITDTAYYVNALGIQNSSARVLPAGAVVFTRDATVGLCAITTRPMAVSQHLIAWICSKMILPEYLLYVFRSMTDELERFSMGATIKTIGMPDIRTLATPLPPIEEQRAIVEHIREKISRIDSVLAKLQTQIRLLREYRQTLISNTVTGKIDVRQEALACR